MVNVQSGRVAATFSEAAAATEPSFLPPAIGTAAISRLPSDENILAKLADKLAKKFAMEVSPRFASATRYILKGDDENTRKGFQQARSGAWKLATKSFQAALEEDPDNGPAHNNLAVAYEKLRKYPEAEEEYNKALEAAPDHGKIQANMKGFSEGAEYKELPEDEGGFWRKTGHFFSVITGLSAVLSDTAMDAKGTHDALKHSKQSGGGTQYVPP
jgi:tetratricopeptide (TPR) repeat protein